MRRSNEDLDRTFVGLAQEGRIWRLMHRQIPGDLIVVAQCRVVTLSLSQSGPA